MTEREIKELLDKAFLTVAEVAAIMRVSSTTITNHLASGTLDAVNVAPPGRVNASWRIRSESVKKLLGVDEEETARNSTVA